MPFPYSFPFLLGGDLTASYARQLQQLLPRGVLWNLKHDSWLSKLLLGIAEEFGLVEARSQDLVDESDPRTAVQTLSDWERVLGLPDEVVTTIPSTIERRRLAITQKLIRQGGQHPSFYVSLAAACGYIVTIAETYADSVFRAGHRCGESVRGSSWAYAWRVDVQPPTGTALTHAELEGAIRRAAPSHTYVYFSYL